MPLFGQIDYDGRVQRAAEALSETHEVIAFSIDSGNNYVSAKFESRVIKAPRLLLRTRCLRGFLYLYFWLALIHAAVRARPPVIFAHDFLLALPGWIAARLTGARLVYDPHELIVPEANPSHNEVNRIWYLLENWVVRRASLVIAANAERADIMQAHYGLDRLPIVIRNIPPLPAKVWEEQETLCHYPELKRDHPDTIQLVYVGNMNMKRRLDKFVAAMNYLPHRFELVMVGAGLDLENLQQQAKRCGVERRVKFLGRAPESHLQHILRICDIGIIAYSQFGMNNIYCASNKLFEYLQAGLPVVSTRQRSLQPIICGFRVGELVACDQARDEDAAREIAAAVGRLADDMPAYKARIPRFLQTNNWESERLRLIQAVNDL